MSPAVAPKLAEDWLQLEPPPRVGPGRSPGSKHTHPNVLRRHSQHPRQRHPRIGPVPHQRLGPAPPSTDADDKDRITPQSLIIDINGFRGLFPSHLSAAFSDPTIPGRVLLSSFGRQGQRIPAVLLAERQGLLLVDCPPPAPATSPAHQPGCPAGCCRGSGRSSPAGCGSAAADQRPGPSRPPAPVPPPPGRAGRGGPGPSPVAVCRPASSMRALGRGTAPVPSDPA